MNTNDITELELTDLKLKQLCWHSIDAFEDYSYTKNLVENELRKRYPDLSARQINQKRKQLGESFFKNDRDKKVED